MKRVDVAAWTRVEAAISSGHARRQKKEDQNKTPERHHMLSDEDGTRVDHTNTEAATTSVKKGADASKPQDFSSDAVEADLVRLTENLHARHRGVFCDHDHDADVVRE